MFSRNRLVVPALQKLLVRYVSRDLVHADHMKALKRNAPGDGARQLKHKFQKPKKLNEGSHEVLLGDVRHLISTLDLGENSNLDLPAQWSEVEVDVKVISSTGDGLGVVRESNRVYVVPFTIPGDRVKAKVVRHDREDPITTTDFLEVIQASPQRDDSRIKCQYFARCSGCQFQMMAYEDQLKHKKAVLERAYKDFSNLAPHFIPTIGDTVGSPLQYGYRTKLTPHFDGPPNARRARKNGGHATFSEVPPIGYMQKGTRKTIDIESCPIGTDVLNVGMKLARENVKQNLQNYRRGATLLLRESTERARQRLPSPRVSNPSKDRPEGQVDSEGGSLETTNVEPRVEGLASAGDSTANTTMDNVLEKTCVTDNNALTTEYVDDYVFTNTAGAFFQNNNSILPDFTSYIRDHILPVPSPSASPRSASPSLSLKYLVDAYCGSGLFTVTLSSLFHASVGIDISEAGIIAARNNASANNVSNAKFVAADAAAIFRDITFPPDETVVMIDPPRKGCDEPFLSQLVKFAPRRVVYVSCNVHTQARDVGVLVEGRGGVSYGLCSLRGFDFFPQTGHVEGVAILDRVDEMADDQVPPQDGTGTSVTQAD